MLIEDMLSCASIDKKEELKGYLMQLEYKYLRIRSLLSPLRTREYSSLNEAYDISVEMSDELY